MRIAIRSLWGSGGIECVCCTPVVRVAQGAFSSARTRAAADSYVPEFVHLKDVTITGGEAFKTPRWRGRLTSVDGIIIGQKS